MLLFFADTECTKLVDKSKAFVHPDQPYCVDVGMGIYCTDQRKLLIQQSFLIYHGKDVISEENSKIHGITNEMCKADGISPDQACVAILALVSQAEYFGAYNTDFDIRVLRTLFARDCSNDKLREAFSNTMNSIKSFCVMEQAKKACKMPPTQRMVDCGNNSYKPPKLIEAYKILFNEDMAGAHRAINDILATVRIYEKIRDDREADQMLQAQLFTKKEASCN